MQPASVRKGRRDRDPALGEQILDVAKAEGEQEIEPDRLVNDLSENRYAAQLIFFMPLANPLTNA